MISYQQVLSCLGRSLLHLAPRTKLLARTLPSTQRPRVFPDLKAHRTHHPAVIRLAHWPAQEPHAYARSPSPSTRDLERCGCASVPIPIGPPSTPHRRWCLFLLRQVASNATHSAISGKPTSSKPPPRNVQFVTCTDMSLLVQPWPQTPQPSSWRVAWQLSHPPCGLVKSKLKPPHGLIAWLRSDPVGSVVQPSETFLLFCFFAKPETNQRPGSVARALPRIHSTGHNHPRSGRKLCADSLTKPAVSLHCVGPGRGG